MLEKLIVKKKIRNTYRRIPKFGVFALKTTSNIHL